MKRYCNREGVSGLTQVQPLVITADDSDSDSDCDDDEEDSVPAFISPDVDDAEADFEDLNSRLGQIGDLDLDASFEL